MAVAFQVTFDCADPRRMAKFWAQALGYKEQDPPEGWDSWEAWAEDQGIPREQFDSMSAVVDPAGHGPRLLFQRVPEPKSVKNRVHLDLNVGVPRDDPESSRARVVADSERLVALGATKLRETEERGEFWIVMQDPEGNEFCLQ
jgi:catechol 2,3-dioxygenase-like lactoylglutathione lyase family enzyme